MLRQTLSILFFTGLFAIVTQAQDPIFSQFYAAPLQINPAFAGNSFGPHVAINYRNQWPSIQSGAYTTYAASYDQYIDKANSGFGLMVLADDAGQGLIKTNRVSGLYAYRLQMDKNFFVKLGVEASFVQTRLDWDQLLFFDQIDPEVGPVSPGGTPFPTSEVRPDKLSNSYLDLSAGMLVYSSRFYGGLSIKHLNTPDESILGINENLDNGLPLRFTAHAGAEFKLTPGNKRRPAAFISPNVLFMRQGDFGQLNVGAYGNNGFVFAGVWYRHAFTNPDAVIFLAGVQQGIFKIGYSYDLSVSGLSGQTGGSHEISLSITMDQPRGYDLNDCLNMFR